MNTTKRLTATPLVAAVVLAVTLIIEWFTFPPIQEKLGMAGLAISELMILAIALVAALICKVDLKQMISFRRPKIRQIAGTLIMWVGTFLLVLLVNMVVFYFFPAGLKVSTELSDFMTGAPFLVSVLVVSVMPAICEEALHRGFLQTALKNRITNRKLIMLIMGIAFGLFHLSVYRFPGTAILGAVLAYVLLETENFLYPMLFHFTNNFVAEVASYAVSEHQPATTVTTLPLISVAAYFILGAGVPAALLGGAMLLQGKDKVKAWGKKKITGSIVGALAVGILLFVIGVILMGIVISNGGLEV